MPRVDRPGLEPVQYGLAAGRQRFVASYRRTERPGANAVEVDSILAAAFPSGPGVVHDGIEEVDVVAAGATAFGTASRPGIRSIRVTGRISAGPASGGIRSGIRYNRKA